MEVAVEKIKRYESYKDSGVAWLGEIPEHWEAIRMKHLYKDVSIKNRPNELLSSVTQDRGVIPRDWIENRMVMPSGSLESFKFIEKDDFAISLRSFEGGLEYCHHDGVISPAYTVLKRKRNNLLPLYYRYLFKSISFISELQTSVVGIREGKNISYNELSYSLLPIPPLKEQTVIAQFLDDKTTKIDQAIAIKEQQISLLKERKQILIHKAVTRGLDDTVALADSGVDWIGEIPEHWEVKPLKYIGNSIIGLTYSPNDLCDEDQGTLVFRASNLFDGKIKYGDNVYVKSRIPDKLMVKENDILICSRSGSRDLIGKCALISKQDNGASFGAFTTVFRSEINPYIFCILNSSIFQALSGSFLTSTINQLTIGNLNSIFVPVPSKCEQEELKNYIDDFSQKIDTAIGLKWQEIEKLKEYKGSLVNGVVTGKVKIL